MWFGESMAKALFEAMQRLFSLSRDEIFDNNKLLEIAGGAFGQSVVSTALDSHHFVCGGCDWALRASVVSTSSDASQLCLKRLS